MVQGGQGETKVKGEAMAKDPRLCMDQGTKEAMVKYQGRLRSRLAGKDQD